MLKVILRAIVKIDSVMVAKNLTYSRYETIQKKFKYPIIKSKFYIANGYWPNLQVPRTFNEFIVSDKLFSRNLLLPIIADKYRVRQYVSDKIGGEYLIPYVKLYDTIEDVILEGFQENTILKATHASGLNLIIKDLSSINLTKAESTVKTWFNNVYKSQLLLWFTRHMERKVIVEKLLTDEKGRVPKDFKFFIIKVKLNLFKLIKTDLNRIHEYSMMQYGIVYQLNITLKRVLM